MTKKTWVKFLALIIFTCVAGLILLTDNRAISTTHAFSAGPPVEHTNAPGELSCTECHGGTANTGSGQFTITAPRNYEPGMTYQITVRHTTQDSSRRIWGFQLTVLADANNARAGTLQPSDNLTQLDTSARLNRQYIEHTFNGSFQGQGNGATWTFNWTAPDENVGRIIFYASGNQGNNNGANNGDQIYTTTATINPALTGPPRITNAAVNGKKLAVTGENFDIGASLFIDGAKQKKVENDESSPSTMLVAKKSGKNVARGSTVTLTVRNPDGTVSEPFQFTRP